MKPKKVIEFSSIDDIGESRPGIIKVDLETGKDIPESQWWAYKYKLKIVVNYTPDEEDKDTGEMISKTKTHTIILSAPPIEGLMDMPYEQGLELCQKQNKIFVDAKILLRNMSKKPQTLMLPIINSNNKETTLAINMQQFVDQFSEKK